MYVLGYPLFATSPEQVDKVFFDNWSGIHAATGIVMGLLDFRLEQSVFLATGWELIENSPVGLFLWFFVGDQFYSGDTLPNICTDILLVTMFSRTKKNFGERISVIFLCMCFIYYQSYTFHLRIEQQHKNQWCFCIPKLI